MRRILNPHTFLGSLSILAALVVFAPAPGQADTLDHCSADCGEKGSCSCTNCNCSCDKQSGTPVCETKNGNRVIHTPQGAPAIIGPFGGDVSTVTVARVADHGDITAMTDGSFLYMPHQEFTGLDSFALNICNVSGECGLGTVLVDVTPPSSSKP